MATQAVVKQDRGVLLKPMNQKSFAITIIGTTSMIQHKWASKALRELLEKKMGKKTRDRTPCVPEKEFEDATYRTADGGYGVPAMSIKSAIITAAHKDIGIEKTLVRKALFIKCPDPTLILPLRCEPPIMREDIVRVANGSPDLRYRPEFAPGWQCDLDMTIDADLLTPEDVVNLIERAGFGVGVGEWRPEKGGEYGRFSVMVKK